MPELRDYLHAYWKQRWMILAVVVVASATTWTVAITRPTRSAVTAAFAINRADRQVTPDYQFDGYYALQAADLFAQTVVSWFQTPPILQEVYEAAKLNPEIDSVNNLPSRFKVKKYSAQNIVVRFQESTPERAKQLSVALKKNMEERAAALNQNAEGQSIFSIVAATPAFSEARAPALLLTIGMAIVSFGFALLVAALRYYLGVK